MLFEEDNIRAYMLLQRIEIALRELLGDSLKKQNGSDWRKNLPNELLKKIKSAQSDENRPQFDYVLLGPLYYLTFGELLELLNQKSGKTVIKQLGGNSIFAQLQNIMSPRNAVCHSRPVSCAGLKTIETIYAQIETALTPTGFKNLIKSPEVGLGNIEAANELIKILLDVQGRLHELPPTVQISDTFYRSIIQYWWANDDLAGFNRSSVEATFNYIKEYSELPKGVGSAGLRHQYCDQHNLIKSIQTAINELRKVAQ
jgi:hypothetical protein